jgi:predicted amidohydrolase YtcJ
VLIVRAEVSEGCIRDVRTVDTQIVEVADRVEPRPNEEMLDAGACAVLPGLHDHHVHLRALAAASNSIDLRTVQDVDALRESIRTASEQRPSGSWLRFIGYHESIAGELDRAKLDELVPGNPARVQHRTGALWILNSAAMVAAGLAGAREPGVNTERGHLLRRDDLLRRVSTLDDQEIARLGITAAAAGVTGFTDATPGGTSTDARDLARDLRSAGVMQNLHLMGPVGAQHPDVPRATLGPVKVLLDDDALPSLDALVANVRNAHHDRRPIAIHCVTRVQLVLACAALEEAGTIVGDRIEHGSVIPAELIGTLAMLGVTIVTQPHFITERGDDYLEHVERDDRDSLYRIRSLLDGGLRVAAGTDAPFGRSDPWPSIAAAMRRTTRSGRSLGLEEQVDCMRAVNLYLGYAHAPSRPRTIAPGSAADLCVLTKPWRELATSVEKSSVRTTIIAGRTVHSLD